MVANYRHRCGEMDTAMSECDKRERERERERWFDGLAYLSNVPLCPPLNVCLIWSPNLTNNKKMDDN